MIHAVKNAPYKDRVMNVFYADIYQFAVNELLRFAEIQTQLDLFLFEDPTSLPFMRYLYQPPNSFWKRISSSG